MVWRSRNSPHVDVSASIAGTAQWDPAPNCRAPKFDGVSANDELADGTELTIAYNWRRAPA